jgi:hypothetical protein
LCRKYSDELGNCATGVSSNEYMWLDLGSSIFKKCSGEFQNYVRCQATTYKIAAPFSPIVSIPGYDLANISGASRVVLPMITFVITTLVYLLF